MAYDNGPAAEYSAKVKMINTRRTIFAVRENIFTPRKRNLIIEEEEESRDEKKMQKKYKESTGHLTR
jgi:hypothetical protein